MATSSSPPLLKIGKKIIPKIVKCNNCESLHLVDDYCKSILKGGKDQTEVTLSIDDIIDQEDPFEGLEPILPQEVYPILVLAMINNIRSDTVMEAILEGLQKGIKQYKKSN